MEIEDRDIDKVEEFAMVFDGLTTRKEDDDLLFGISSEEGE